MLFTYRSYDSNRHNYLMKNKVKQNFQKLFSQLDYISNSAIYVIAQISIKCLKNYCKTYSPQGLIFLSDDCSFSAI